MNRASAAVIGMGHSEVYRRDEVPLGVLVVDACRQAIADAGLEPSDIDGVSSNPGQPFSGAGDTDGLSHVSVGFAIRALGLENLRWSESIEYTAVVTDPFIAGVHAVASGACENVLVFRGLHNPSGRRYGSTRQETATGAAQFQNPYGFFTPALAGLLWQAYLSKYGGSREDMADFVVNARQNGLLWDYSYWRKHRPEPLTRADYLSARLISWPVSILDCDLPVQGAGAFVITRADRAADFREKPAYILATSRVPVRNYSMYAPLEDGEASNRVVAENLWRKSGIGPQDVDVANLYDGFSILAALWLEGLGFCGHGEAFSFMKADRIGLEGELPLNTSGGNLGAGRMHGVPHLMEGARQVMGESGSRQVKDARFSLATVGSPGVQGAVLYSSELDVV